MAPTDAAAFALAGSISADAVADAVEVSQALDVEMDQFAGSCRS